VWKLETPAVDIVAQVSMPTSQNDLRDLQISKASCSRYLQSISGEELVQKKVIGGLLTHEVVGTLIHTNTIEEF
jgi:hypothetical protein